MNAGRTVFSQLMDFAPQQQFRRLVERHGAGYRVRDFSCWDQFLCMAFAQLTYREGLRDIEACLRAAPSLQHLGFRTRSVARSTLADANAQRSWRLYADFAQRLIKTARRLYASDSFGVELEHTVYALDSTLIDLCLSLCPWARPRGTSENRPMRDTSKAANGREAGQGCYTAPKPSPAIQFRVSGGSRPILDAPGRRIRLRRDATGAPSRCRNGGAGASRPAPPPFWREGVKSREREGSVLASKEPVSLCVQSAAAVLVRQLRGPHLSTWP